MFADYRLLKDKGIPLNKWVKKKKGFLSCYLNFLSGTLKLSGLEAGGGITQAPSFLLSSFLFGL